MIPAPILFGALIDHACLSWQYTPGVGGGPTGSCNTPPADSSSRKGACFMYDNYAMGSYLLALVFSCKILALAFFFIALFCYKPPPKPANAAGAVAEVPDTCSTAGGEGNSTSVSRSSTPGDAQVVSAPVVDDEDEKLSVSHGLGGKGTLVSDPT